MAVGPRSREGRYLARAQIHDHQVVGAAPFLHRHGPRAVGGHVGKRQALAPREPLHRSVRRGAVQVAGQAVGVVEVQLGEQEVAAGHPRQGAPDPVDAREAAGIRPVGRGNADLGRVHSVRADKGEPSTVGGGHGLLGKPSRPLHGLRLRYGGHLREHLCLREVRLLHVLGPRRPAVRHRRTEGVAGRRVEPVRDPQAGHGAREVTHGLLAVRVGHVRKVACPVHVRAMARGPDRRVPRHLVHGSQRTLQRCRPHHHLLPGAPHAPRTRELRLEVGCEPLGDPGGCRARREDGPGGGQSAEQLADDLADGARHVQVEGVHQFVRDDECQPVVEVRDAPALHRRTREDRDAVVRDRRREAVGDVGVIGQEQLDRDRRRVDETIRQQCVRPLRGVGRPFGHRGETCRVGHDEMIRGELAPVFVGRRGLGPQRSRGCETQDGERKRDQPLLAVVYDLRHVGCRPFHRSRMGTVIEDISAADGRT